MSYNMKEYLKYIGMVIVILGTIYLMLVVLAGLDNNHHLLISGAIIVVGLIVHVVISKEIE